MNGSSWLDHEFDNYQVVAKDDAAAVQRGILNFTGAVTVTDNPSTGSTDVAVAGTDTTLDGKNVDAPSPSNVDLLMFRSADQTWINFPANVLPLDDFTFGSNARALSHVHDLVTNDTSPGQDYSTTIYAIPASTTIDCVATAVVMNLTDGSVDLMDFRAQFRRIGSGAAAAIGTPDYALKIGNGDEVIEFALSSNNLQLHLVAAGGDTRNWTVTVQIQMVQTT